MQSMSLFGTIPTMGKYVDPQTGRPIVLTNSAKFAQKSFWLQNDAVIVGANATAQNAMTPPRDQGDQGDTEAFLLMARSTANFAVRMYSEILDRYHSNRPVESTLIFGDSSFPAELLESLYIPATSSLRLELTDLSGFANTVDVIAHGKQVLNPIANLGKNRLQIIQANSKQNTHAYWLTFDDGAQIVIPANGTFTANMTVPSDADFNAWQLLSRSDQGENSYTIDIREGQRRSLMSRGAVPIALVAAQTLAIAGAPAGIVPAAGAPFVLPDTHLFERNTIIEVVMNDTSGNNNTVSLAWGGQLIYYPRSPGGLALA